MRSSARQISRGGETAAALPRGNNHPTTGRGSADAVVVVPRERHWSRKDDRDFADVYESAGVTLGQGCLSTVTVVRERSRSPPGDGPGDSPGGCPCYAAKLLMLAPEDGAFDDSAREAAGKARDKVDDRHKHKFCRRGEALREVKMLSELDHPAIVPLTAAFFSAESCRIVTPLMRGGDLLDAQRIRGSLAEDDARSVMRSLFGALRYMHGRGIAHRDIKLENVMLERADDFDSAKLIDLGLAKRLGAGRLSRPCGTPLYVAPESLCCVEPGLSLCGVQCDMWSVGVVLFLLLSGAPPFAGASTVQQLFRRIRRGAYSFSDPAWELISPEAHDLVRRLMTVCPDARITAAEALQHPWMTL